MLGPNEESTFIQVSKPDSHLQLSVIVTAYRIYLPFQLPTDHKCTLQQAALL